MPKKKVTKKRGPKAETVRIAGDWKDAVKTALGRGKPATPKKGAGSSAR